MWAGRIAACPYVHGAAFELWELAVNVGIEALFTSALGLQPPWAVEEVKLDPAKRRIDFEVRCHAARLDCPQALALARRNDSPWSAMV
jgi:hypothetical protein